MTKEELEQEAEEYADTVKCEWENDTYWVDCRDEITDAYIAGAEPREKRIADLESTKEELVKSNQTIRSKLRTLKNDYEEYETAHIALVEKYRDLEKENAELKAITDFQTSSNMDRYFQLKRSKEQLTKAKEIMNIAIEGIKHWGIVGGTERPFEKQAEKLFNLFLDKAEQFLNS